jgi:branched-subunit amino acid permease
LTGLSLGWHVLVAAIAMRAEQLVAVSFVLLTVDVTVESAGDLTGGHQPATSWVGIALSAITLVAMPPLAAVSGVSATLAPR